MSATHRGCPVNEKTDIEPRPHTTVRVERRGSYDRRLIDTVLDEALVAHIGFVDDGRPVVIPMLHARVGDTVYIHGSPATRLVRTLKKGPEICLTATIVDALVLARSAFNHSANYRSAMVFGRPEPVADLDRRRAVLDAYTDKIVPGRRRHLRPMTEKEIRATAVLGLEITEASAKMRSGPPADEPEDLDLPIWSGVIPVVAGFGPPLDDPDDHAGIEVPEHVMAMVGGT
jgi:uncharacterized protein